MNVVVRFFPQLTRLKWSNIMSWPQPKVIDTLNPPVKLHRGRWLVFFIILMVITGITFALMWPNNNYLKQWTFWFGLISIPTIVSGVALSIRFYLYGLAQEEYEIWQQEQKIIQQNWQVWAMKSLIVLDSYYSLPNQITAKQILVDRSNLSVQINNSLKFDEKLEVNQHIEDLFFSLRPFFSKLPLTEPINITMYSSDQSYSYVDDDIYNACRAAKIDQPYTFSHKMGIHADIEKLVEWIDIDQKTLQLVIINNTKSSNSAFLCAFLLMDKQQYKNLSVDIAKAEILRPMTADNLQVAINQMVELQPAICQVNQLWFANMDNKQEVNITKQLADLNISPEQMYKLESLVGNQNELSYWISLALGCEMVTETKQNNLITAMSQNQWLFSVVTAVNLGVMNE